MRPADARRKAGSPLVRQPHGGAIHQGRPSNPAAGPGRPKDEVRERLLGIAQGTGLEFLTELMAGRIYVRLTPQCEHCGSESEPLTPEELELLIDRIGTSVDQRLKGLDQLLRYGLGTKDELDVTAHPEVQRFVAIHAQATREVVGPTAYARIVDRVKALTT